MSTPDNTGVPDARQLATASTAPRDWRRAKTVARWLATGGLVTWLVVHIDWASVKTSLASASILWLTLAAACYFASQLASVARWRLLVRAAGLSRSIGQLWTAYFEGMFVNVCVPTPVGGDLLKVVRIGGTRDKRTVAATVAIDRIAGLAALFALLGLALAAKLDSKHNSHFAMLFAAATVASLVAFEFVLKRVAAKYSAVSLRLRSSSTNRWSKITRILPDALGDILLNTSWSRVFVWALVVQGLGILGVAAAAEAIGLNVPIATIAVATTTVSLATALPISIAGIGVREASLPILLAADGVSREMAVALGVAWSATVLIIGLVGGPIHFVQQRKHHHDQPFEKEQHDAAADPIAKRRAA